MQSNSGMYTDYPLYGTWSVSLINSTNQQYGKYIEIVMNKFVKINDLSDLNVTFQFLIANKAYNKSILTYTGPYNIPINNITLNINILINQSGQIPGKYIILKRQYFGFENNSKYIYICKIEIKCGAIFPE